MLKLLSACPSTRDAEIIGYLSRTRGARQKKAQQYSDCFKQGLKACDM